MDSPEVSGLAARVGAAWGWVRRHALLVVIIFEVIYWPIAMLVPPAYIQQWLSWVLLAISMGVVLSFLPLAAQYARHGQLDRTGFLVVGIELAWIVVLFMRARLLLFGGTQWAWLSSPLLNDFLLWVSLSAAVLHIIAANMIAGRVPRGNVLAIMAAVFVAGVFVGGLAVFSVLGAYQPG